MRRTTQIAAALCVAAISTSAVAEAGDWLIRAGATRIWTQGSDKLKLDDGQGNPLEAEVSDETAFTFDITYMINEHVGVELLGAYPVEHDIDINGTKAATTKQLPPTLSVNYHITRWGAFKPYFGAGINYTNFFDEDGQGPLSGADIELDDSWGLAYQIGADYAINEKWFLNVVGRYLTIGTKAKVEGTDVGNVDINPWTLGANIGYRF